MFAVRKRSEKKSDIRIEDHKNGHLLTAKQVEYLFGVTPTSIHNYRRKNQLPVHHLHSPGLVKPPVRFDEGEILKWASMNNIEIKNDLANYQ
jgi:hypothetical protein